MCWNLVLFYFATKTVECVPTGCIADYVYHMSLRIVDIKNYMFQELYSSRAALSHALYSLRYSDASVTPWLALLHTELRQDSTFVLPILLPPLVFVLSASCFPLRMWVALVVQMRSMLWVGFLWVVWSAQILRHFAISEPSLFWMTDVPPDPMQYTVKTRCFRGIWCTNIFIFFVLRAQEKSVLVNTWLCYIWSNGGSPLVFSPDLNRSRPGALMGILVAHILFQPFLAEKTANSADAEGLFVVFPPQIWYIKTVKTRWIRGNWTNRWGQGFAGKLWGNIGPHHLVCTRLQQYN